MSDPRRYLDDEHAAPLARAILGSASDDGLDGRRLAAIARVLEADTAVAAGERGGRGPEVRPRVPAAPALAGVAAVAAVAAVVYGTTFGGATDHVQPSPPATAAPRAVVAPSAEHAAPLAVATTPPDAVSVDLLPEAPPAPPHVPTSTRAAATPSPAASDDLAAEVRALERVRAALAEHRIADARDGLASYERAFSRKLLANEARVLEIEMLLADGHSEEADARASEFLASSANSPYADRVRSLVGRPRRP